MKIHLLRKKETLLRFNKATIDVSAGSVSSWHFWKFRVTVRAFLWWNKCLNSRYFIA